MHENLYEMEWAQDLMQWLCFCKEFQHEEEGETTVLTSSSHTTTVTRIPRRRKSVDSNTSNKVHAYPVADPGGAPGARPLRVKIPSF